MSYCEIHSRTRNAAGECLACELEKATAQQERAAFRVSAIIGTAMAVVVVALIGALWGLW